MDVGISYARLCNLADRKREMMQLYLVQVEKQADLVTAENMEGLAAVLQEKERLIDGIDMLDRESLKIEELIDPGEISFRDNGKKELASIRGAIQHLVAQALEKEQENAQCLQEASRKLRLRLDQLEQGRQSMAIYAPQVRQNGGVFIDRKE